MMQHKTLSSTFTSDDGTTFKAVVTTDAIDRDGEVVIPAGMNSKEYERNPTLLFGHDAGKPIGKMISLRRQADSIEGEFALAPRPEAHEGEWLPDTVGALMRFGALRGVSIGFTPQAGGVRQASKADRERYGTDVKRVFSKWTLLEVSVVSIPANQQALVTAVSKGLLTLERARQMDASIPDNQPQVEKHRVSIVVPSMGFDDATHAARVALARAKGRFTI